MQIAASYIEDELMDVLYAVEARKDGTIAFTFINGAGEKVILTTTRDAARDLCEELNDLNF